MVNLAALRSIRDTGRYDHIYARFDALRLRFSPGPGFGGLCIGNFPGLPGLDIGAQSS